MKKLILLAMLFTASLYQSANAQVSLNVNFGTRPYYAPSYYAPAPQYVYTSQPRYVYRNHYVPVNRVIVHQPVYKNRNYRASYARPHQYSSKQTYYRSNVKYNNGHHKSKGRRHSGHRR